MTYYFWLGREAEDVVDQSASLFDSAQSERELRFIARCFAELGVPLPQS